jgi:hypothetical protein
MVHKVVVETTRLCSRERVRVVVVGVMQTLYDEFSFARHPVDPADGQLFLHVTKLKTQVKCQPEEQR